MPLPISMPAAGTISNSTAITATLHKCTYCNGLFNPTNNNIHIRYAGDPLAECQKSRPAPTIPCLECGQVHWIWNNIFDDYECDDGSIHIRSRFYTDQLNVSKDDEPTLKLDLSHLHIHVSGITPLQNPKKGNKMFIICKLCGEDLEEWKP